MLKSKDIILRDFKESDIEKRIYWETEETEIYIQTWSGNERMVHIAEKMGFEECDRKKNFRTVRGRTYDGLTFRLNEQKYAVFKETYAL